MLIAIIRRKPIIVVAGGNEATFYRDSVTGAGVGYLAGGVVKRLITRFVINHASELISVSRYMQKNVEKFGRFDSKLIYNCVDINIFRPGNPAKRDFLLTSFRIQTEVVNLKRGANIIKAIAHVVKTYPKIKLKVIGSIEDGYPLIIDLCQKLNILKNVDFLGSLDNTQIPSFLQQSLAFLQPSDTETFGVAVVEAMSAGTPVIVSSAGALKEVVGEHGIYVDQNDPISIANGILRVLQMDEYEYMRLSIACRGHVVENYSIDERRRNIHSLLDGFQNR